MNKRELIGKIIDLPYEAGVVTDTLKINRAGLIKLIDQFDEPQKVTIPQFVADWIEVCKEHLPISLYTAMNPNFMKQNNQSADLMSWIEKSSNQEIFAQAWIFGYTVEKEKRYLVKIKGVACPYLNHDTINELWFYNQKIEGAYTKTQHTRKELEEAGFGWVFDCPGIEIEVSE